MHIPSGETTRRKLLIDTFGKFRLNEGLSTTNPTVLVFRDQIEIGCTTVSREAVEAAMKLFEEHFPKKTISEYIKVQ